MAGEVDKPLYGAILCGGLSSRMGTNKALLSMRPGIRQLDYAAGLLSPRCESVLACTGPASRVQPVLPAGVTPVIDPARAVGPMAGVIAALEHAAGYGVLVLACDMPWVDERVLDRLLAARDPGQWITAFVAGDGEPEPMCAIYEPAALGALNLSAVNGQMGLRQFMKQAQVALLELAQPGLLASVNDLYELQAAHDDFADRGE